MTILQHLQERLRQRNLRQQIARSKTISPIIDSINLAAKLEGISPEEIVNDYVSGKFEHPVISAALVKPAATASATPATPATPAQIRSKFAAMKPGPERTAFYAKHREILKL